MVRAKNIKLAIVGGLVFAIFCLALCSCSNVSPDGSAAKVNDVSISEEAVTAKVQEYRAQTNLTSDEAWAEYLSANKLTNVKVRSQLLDELIDSEVYRQIADEEGISASSQDELVDKVNQIFIDKAKPSKEAYGQLLLAYGGKLNGSKGYYHIMIPIADEAHARQVYSQVKSGALDFRSAIDMQMDNDPEGVNFNYVIYDCMIESPQACKDALAKLHTGQMSELIKTEKYWYIYNVVDEISCEVPLSSLSSLSEYTQENLRYYAKIMDQQNILKAEFATAKKDFTIIKYDSPKELEY